MILRALTAAAGRVPGLAWAVTAEAAWHLAGPAWAFGVLALAIGWLAARLPAAAAAAAAKAYNVEDRLNALVPKIPSPKAAPGGHSDTTTTPGNTSYGASNSSYNVSNTSYGTSNSSYGMNSGTQVVFGASTNGGFGSVQTSGQIGGASAHYHTYTHYHTSSSELENIFNALRGSHSALVPAFNDLRDSHSTLLPAVNELRNSHSALVPAVNELRNSHSDLVVHVQALRASHADLSAKHNTLIDTIKTTKLLT